MKKVLLSAVALFAFGFANAQESTSAAGFSKGDVFVSGGVGISSTKTGDAKTNGFNFSPKAGYFVTENIAVGLALGFASTKDEDDTKDTNFSAGAFGRYYFTPSSQFSVFGQLGVNMNNTKHEEVIGGTTFEAKANGFDVKLAPGISYFVSDHFAIEATFGALGYETSKPDADGAESTDTFGLNLNLDSINFGLVYKF
ncbi:outer membrane beta-barrel protein [Flavobacterium sp.]|uniref:outer membrane beta-barrel protein n=1 Tax=Flavobacterium sp. TaxID=239 RepID=UPI0026193DEB|nr:outer membrane beta-barrel protein [Flavobacterium sp.]